MDNTLRLTPRIACYAWHWLTGEQDYVRRTLGPAACEPLIRLHENLWTLSSEDPDERALLLHGLELDPRAAATVARAIATWLWPDFPAAQSELETQLRGLFTQPKQPAPARRKYRLSDETLARVHARLGDYVQASQVPDPFKARIAVETGLGVSTVGLAIRLLREREGASL